MAEETRTGAPELSLNELLRIRREKLTNLQDAGRDPFAITRYDVTHHSAEILAAGDELVGKEVSVAGRMMVKRIMGKASFCKIQDKQGVIQCYVARDDLGEEAYAEFKKMDIGDIIGVKGEVFRTKTGELSVRATELTLLAKSDMASFVDSLVAPLSLLNALVVAVGLEKQAEISHTYAQLEHIWDEYNVYEKTEEENTDAQ